MYKILRKPDKTAALKNGSEVTPVCTLADEYGGRSHIIVDDGCYVLINGGVDQPYGMSAWWYREAIEALRDLPTNPEDVEKIR